MPTIQPPPTWAEVTVTDPRTGRAKFSPVWLKWFLDLAGILSSAGGGTGTIQHNSLGGLQGGTANQFYHFDFVRFAILSVANAGVWTPTLTNVTNISASTAYVSMFTRIGDIVTFAGRVEVDPTASGACELGISLPIPSNFTAPEHCSGSGACGDVAGFSVLLQADSANDRMAMRWIATDTANRSVTFSGMYRVL